MKAFFTGFLLAAVLFAGGSYLYIHRHEESDKAVNKAPAVRYHCPMHPTYTSDHPGDCPICGMKLVPIEPASPSPDSVPESMVPGYASVTIPADRIQSMGISTAEVRRMSLDQNFRTFGKVTYDERKIHHVHTRFEGFIEDLYVNYTGQYVKKGQPLFSVYSPELYATQNEYLLALRARKKLQPNSFGSTVDLVEAARERLALWGIGDSELRELERTRTPSRALRINSPVSGYVIARTATHGLKVSPADNLYDIVDLSTVWVLADIYEVNLPLVKLGQTATVQLDYKPGESWKGKVVFIDPTVDPATRTVKARLEFPNPDGELKPEMYAHVVIGGSSGTGIGIPDSAVISTGERNIVFVAKGEGTFEPREVLLGVHVRNLYEIKEGLSEGERVVTGANFLLDSESKLKAATSSSSQHQHGS